MSSAYVRTQIKDFLASELPEEKVIDLSGRYEEIKELIEAEGITSKDPWLGLQFVGNDEVPITINTNNTKGKYREVGVVYLHVVDIAKLGGSGTILARAEALRSALRGRRLGSMFVESVSPPNFDTGATLRFEGGYMSASVLVSYLNDTDL